MPVGEIAWRPSPEMVAEANLTKFIAHCGLADYDALLRRSIDEPEGFYRALFAFIDYRFTKPFTQAIDTSRGLERTRWCLGAETNVTLNCLDKWRGTPTYDKTALEWLGENGGRLSRTYRELDDEACRLAAGLRRLGLGSGDVVAMYLPNIPEAVTTLLAVPKIGAIVLPLFSGFGPDAVAARLVDAGAKAVITVDGSHRRGRVVAAKPVIDAVLKDVPTLKHVIVCHRADVDLSWTPGVDHHWHDLVSAGLESSATSSSPYPQANPPPPRGEGLGVGGRSTTGAFGDAGAAQQQSGTTAADHPTPDPSPSRGGGKDVLSGEVVSNVDGSTASRPADSPYLLVYTSGTTGKPKGVVHTHCGFPVKTMLDLGICMEFKPTDRILWMSDMGWLVGPILVYGTTLIGGTMVLAEGTPDYPRSDRIWQIVSDLRVSYLGIAPTIARSFMADATFDAGRYDLSSLRVFCSTGEAWTTDAWYWLFEVIGGKRCPIVNFSGGTEMGGILTSVVTHPIKPGSFTRPVPGTEAAVFNEAGAEAGPGEVGELVMRRSPIGLTQGLWNDDKRYIETYWSTWPHVWHHGDFAMRDADGFYYILGRSDDTLKIAGKRTGPSEIEGLVLSTGLVKEVAAIGVPDPVKGTAIVCVCVLRDAAPKESAADTISAAVVKGLGTAFRPKAVVLCADLPKTRNMKIMRRVVRAALLGQEPGDLSSLVNPEAIDALRASTTSRK